MPTRLTGLVAVAAGEAHNLGLRSDGTVVVWGDKRDGAFNVPAGLTSVTAIAAGAEHCLALRRDGTVVAWGQNDCGQLNVPAGLSGIIAVAGGSRHSLALRNDGTVVAWGDDAAGQSDVPAGLTGVVALAAGRQHSLALRRDGTVVAWGNNDFGQTAIPVGLDEVTAIAAGGQHSLALRSDGRVMAWGDNSAGQTDVPPGLTGATALAAGESHSVALRRDGTVVAWGNNFEGQLDAPAGLTRVAALAAGGLHNVVLAASAPPLIVSGGICETLEDLSPGGFGFAVVDQDTPVEDLTVTGEVSVPGLVQSLVFLGTGMSRSVEPIPVPNANGTATITLTVSDGESTSTSDFTFTVLPVNDPPTFTKGANPMVNEDAGPQTLVGWAANVRGGPTADELSQTLTFDTSANTNPGLFAAGPVVNPLTGNLTFTPAANASGTANVWAELRDDGGTENGGQSASIPQKFTITVTAVNDAPVAASQSATTAEDSAKGLTLTATDTENAALTYRIVTGPTHGTLSGTAPNVTYTPALNYHGTDSFTFKANDGGGDSNTGTVSLTVTSVYDPPVAADQDVTTLEDTAKSITLTGSSAEDAPLTYKVLTGPVRGTLTGTAPNVTYTPAANYTGVDSFTFSSHDGTSSSDPATIFLTVNPVNDPPVSADQSVTTPEDTAKMVTLTATDVEGSPLTYTVWTYPTHGALSGTAPNLTYTPFANYHGPDSFTFDVADGMLGSNTATVSLTVTAVNDAPIATDASVTTAEDVAKAIPTPATDVDGDVLTYTILSGVTHGVLSGKAPNLTYTPTVNYHGPDSFTFRTNDGTVDSNIATVSITVTSVNDRPVAPNQSVTTDEDTGKPITLTATDDDGDALTYSLLSSPAHGAVFGAPPNVTYIPEANYYGPDSFTFRADDSTSNGNTATINIMVAPVNDAPVALGEVHFADQSTLLTVGAPGLLSNDTDQEGDALTAQLAVGPTHGTLTLNANGSFQYTPAVGFSGTDSFTYRANDGKAVSAPATVTLVVNVNPPTSTFGAQVTGTGPFLVGGKKASVKVTAKSKNGKWTGSLKYTDPDKTRAFTSSALTSVVVQGTHARLFGQGKLKNRTVVAFVLDIDDLGKPGRGKDQVLLQFGNGYTVQGTLTGGNLQVTPAR